VFTAIETMDAEHGSGRMVILVWGEALRSPELATQLTTRMAKVVKELRLFKNDPRTTATTPS
jgi:hypothetical protein